MRILLVVLSLVVISCVKEIPRLGTNQVDDGEYDSEYPGRPTSAYLEKITSTVKSINAMASYKGYDLPFENGLKRSEINDSLIQVLASVERFINTPATGTATVIYNDSQKIALLTCAHIVSFEDTIVTYYLDKFGNNTPIVQSIYYKIRQGITIVGLPEARDFEVLAMDTKKDIAIVGKFYSRPRVTELPVFSYPRGAANELRLGSFVYLFGFPRGEQIVSSALVSRINKNRDHGFVIDAPMHGGISGGIVLAIRDGVPNFELVGMVFAVAGERMQVLSPDKDVITSNNDVQRLYTGDIYINSVRSIIYGLTYVVSIEAIEDFIDDNKDELLHKGFNAGDLLNPATRRTQDTVFQ